MKQPKPLNSLVLINIMLLLYGVMLSSTMFLVAVVGPIAPEKIELAYWMFFIGIAMILWVGVCGIVSLGSKK